MKKTYTEAELELIRLDSDVITESCAGDTCQWEGPCDDD